jgi:membrane-associated phospholipid phosphatase
MLSTRRVTLGGVVCAGVGLALLADAQAWASDMLVWSSLAVFVGLAILVDASARRGDGRDGDGARTVVGGGA